VNDAPYDLIALGETMLSLVATDGTLATAGAMLVTHGGAESNTCVGAARLGLRAAWVGRLGTDAAGDRIAAALASEGVDLRWVVRDPGRPTGLMLRDTVGGLRYERSGSAAAAISPDDLERVPVADARAVFVTGITAMLGEGPAAAAATLLDRANGLRAVDPNLRPNLWGSDRAVDLVLPLFRRADIVLGGESELATLVGGDGGASIAEAVRSLGPREVVVKRGRRGAVAMDGDGNVTGIAPEPVSEVDPVGAGDAFNAAYLAARIHGRPVEDALAEGARCGAAVAATLGDVLGFPRSSWTAEARRDELAERAGDGPGETPDRETEHDERDAADPRRTAR
jgi:2-dehydro-3-deoxygluconokinase